MTARGVDDQQGQEQPSSSLGLADRDIQLAAQLHAPVLIANEHRDRREECARRIHASSAARHGPFIAITSDATLGRHFELARGGTLFIDDIADLTPDAQAQLWSVLENPVASAVRLIAGAGPRLEERRRTGLFAAALFYRLNVVVIDLPDARPGGGGL